MFMNRNSLLLCLTSATLATGVLLVNNEADADLFSQCPARSGSTRFFDFATNACGYVAGNNLNWRALGWNDRADQFANNGNTSNNCLYEHSSCGGLVVHLPRGFTVDWANIVSSNRWTTASSCVRSC